MTGISPADPTYAETFARLSNLLAQEEAEHGKIAKMSQESLLEWFNDFIVRAARILGTAVAKVAAMIDDYVQIGRNAIDTAKNEFRKSYEASRRIKPI